MSGIDHTGKLGGGGEFAKQATNWSTPDVCSGYRDMSKIDPEAQKRSDTKRTTGLVTEAQNWPTPTAQDDNKSPEAYRKMRMEKLGRTGAAADTVSSLQVRVQLWQTPQTSMANGKREPDGKRSLGVNTQAENWPTPNVCSPNSMRGSGQDAQKRKDQGHQVNLQDAARSWPTPSARDHKGANSEEHATLTGGGRKHMDQLSNFVAYSPLQYFRSPRELMPHEL